MIFFGHFWYLHIFLFISILNGLNLILNRQKSVAAIFWRKSWLKLVLVLLAHYKSGWQQKLPLAKSIVKIYKMSQIYLNRIYCLYLPI